MVQIVSVLLVLKSIKSVILLPRILLPLRNARKKQIKVKQDISIARCTTEKYWN